MSVIHVENNVCTSSSFGCAAQVKEHPVLKANQITKVWANTVAEKGYFWY